MTDLLPYQPDAAPAVYDAATLAVLHAMEEAAEKHLNLLPHRLLGHPADLTSGRP
jgi:hypothetical protein